MPNLPSPRSLLRSHPRLLAAAVAAAVAVGAVTAAASDGGDDPQATSAPGPTATAATRDLVTTLEATGTVERVDQRTITYAAALPAPSPEAPSAPTAGTGTATTPTAQDTTVTTTATPGGPPDGEGPVTTTTATSTEAADPGPEGDTSGRDEDNPSPAPTTTTSPTATTTTTTAPPTTTTTTTSPAAADRSGEIGQTTPSANTGQDDEDDVAATLTGVLAVGSDATRGAVLYTADDEPTVALYGAIPMWRTLKDGVAAGADIRQLEENLVALGYGAGVTVDNTFSTATASAIKRWETALGRTEPDGTVNVGDVVYLAGRGAVLSHEATVGEPLDRGTTILTVASQERVVTATVPAQEAATWAPGTSVDLTWADGTHTTATVSAVSTDVVDETVELTVALPETHSERPNGAEVTITAVDARRDDVNAVPVSAIVAGTGGGRAVRIPRSSGDRLTAVTTGLVADGWIEITSGLEPGDTVRLPG